MTELLSLPEEVLQYICTFLVSGHDIRDVVKARETCRLFDRLIISATWKTSALELTEKALNCREEFVVKCVYARTIADWTQQRHKLTRVICELLEFFQKTYKSDLTSGRDYILDACAAFTSKHKCAAGWREPYSLDPRQAMGEFEITHTVQENALAFAAYLGLASVVERLVEEGTRGRYTCFGSPLDCVAKHCDPNMTHIYLDARLKLQERCGPAFSTERHWSRSYRKVDRKPVMGRRDIMWQEYSTAMENAMSFGKLEAVQLLVDAASYDEQFPLIGWDTWFSVRKAPEWSTKTHHYSCVLWYATNKLKLPLAKFALDQGAEANVSTPGRDWSSSALENAARCGSLELFNLLLDHGADIRATYSKNIGLLARAVSGGCPEIVRACLDAGVAHAARYTSFHPLVGAVNRKSPKMLRLLLEHGVDFTVGSELDEELKKAADKIENAEIDAILKLARDDRTHPSAES